MAGKKSFGISVKIGATAIGGLTDVSLGGGDVTFIDTTTHDSTGGWKQFVGGLTDGGTLELSGNYDIENVGQLALIAARATTATITVTFSDLSTVEFSAVVGVYQVENPLDDKIGFSCSLKVTGALTFEEAA